MRGLLQTLAIAGMVGAAAPAFAVDPFFPDFGNGRIDVQSYALDIKAAPPKGAIDATAKLRIVALSDIERFRLDLSGLTVTGVLVNGQPEEFRQTDGKLAIRLRSPIARGETFDAAIAYEGVPRTLEDPTDPSYRLGWFRHDGGSYVVSEPIGASTFFPANDEPTDKATFSFEITVPEGFQAVANGVFGGSRSVEGGRRFSWRMDQPMTTWLATVHINQFALRRTRTAAGLPIRIYTTPGAPEGDAARFGRARLMIPFIEGIAGPYPFESYGSVTVDDPKLEYALESQTMSVFPAAGFADDVVVVHELAHQWFGNLVSVRRWADIWIAEGYATYFEFLWPNRNNPKAFERAMQWLYDYSVDRNVGPAVVEDPSELFSIRVYARGALTLYALRLQVGEERFNAITRAFIARFRDGNATSQDFIRTAVEMSGDKSVRPLLEAWLYEQPIPPLPGAPPAAARRGPVAAPDIFGLRCGRGGHRGSAASCAQQGQAAADSIPALSQPTR